MKKGDIIAVAYFVFFAAVVFFFPWDYGLQKVGSLADFTIGAKFKLFWTGFQFHDSVTELAGLKHFGNVVSAYPYISGFLKVGLLAIFGELIKHRGKTGSWKMPMLFRKFLVWGLFGMLFTIVFALFARGVGSLMGSPIIPYGCKPHSGMSFRETLFFAFTTSFWINMIFCYPMMLAHEWCNKVLEMKRFLGGTEFLEMIDKKIWGSFMLKTVAVFWIPAHTVTFCLPENYRILMSAFLSLALGFILTIRPKKKSEGQPS